MNFATWPLLIGFTVGLVFMYLGCFLKLEGRRGFVAWEVILNLYENFIFFTEIAMEEYGVGDTPDISPTFFFSEVQLAAFSAIFRPFGTEVWIGSFDRIYGRRRRGPARRRKRK